MERHNDRKLRVLVVWEPILPTDWRSPGGSALARLPDNRIRQFWDPKHLVASQLKELANRKPGQQPDCCVEKGFHWDEALFFPPGAAWKDAPLPVFWNGPVYKIVPALEQSLSATR